MKTRLLFLVLLALVPAFAQDCATTRSCTSLYYYDGSGNPTYVCSASTSVAPVVVSKADASLTSIGVASNVGTITTSGVHGLSVGSVVVVSGSTTAALNGTYPVLTVPSTTTYTIATSGVADATYTTAGLVVTTNSPTTGSPVWRIQVFHYTASVLDGVYLGGGSVSYSYRAKCTDRALY